MRIWIDLANSPHVPFFRAIIKELIERGHEVVVTARDFAETVSLAESAGLGAEVIGGHGGGRLSGKVGNLVQRAMALARWARGRGIDMAVSHNSYSQILATRVLSLRSVTLMDYEHQPANHLAFRFASRIIVPQTFPKEALTRYGAQPAKVRKYSGLKEDVYLAGFQPNSEFEAELAQLGISRTDILVTVRPPATGALYHRFENARFEDLLNHLSTTPNTKVVLLPRSEAQRDLYRQRSNLIVPTSPLDGANLIAHSDLVVSGGGTMNREAAALGVPAVSIYAGEWAAIDEQLRSDGRLQRISTRSDIDNLKVAKKGVRAARNAIRVLDEVTNLILE